jgi:tRNA-specific 2-thiouridylase
LGEHAGVAFFTIGQRRGLGVVSRDPLYVIDLDPTKRMVVVGPEDALFATDLVADDVNLVGIGDLHQPLAVKARIRYRMADAEAVVWQEIPGQLRLRFAHPQRAITPGQSLVCYDGDVVVAGGTIARTLPLPGCDEPVAAVSAG